MMSPTFKISIYLAILRFCTTDSALHFYKHFYQDDFFEVCIFTFITSLCVTLGVHSSYILHWHCGLTTNTAAVA